MVREISAGGVVIRKRGETWWMAAIEPPTEAARTAERATSGRSKPGRSGAASSRHSSGWRRRVLALPKGLVDPGEKAMDTAVREVFEETGVTAEPLAKLADSKYVYTRAWGDGLRVFKVVSFYLMRYRSGRINDITPAMRIEVARARWVRLEDAPRLLAYTGEKQMARRALEYVKTHEL
jgi:8-oxo-dGTP pyrophosphatase MutT (NUDIX family)